MKSMGALAILALAVIIIIVALGAYAWLTLSKYLHAGSPQVYRALLANHTGTLSQVLGNMTGGFNTSQFAVSYSGNATVDIGGLQITLPVSVSLARYYNDSRAELDIRDIPLIGNVSSVQVKDGSSYYSCWEGVNSSRSTYSCRAQDPSNSVFTVLDMATGGQSQGGFGPAQIHYGVVNQSSHNGMPCTNINGYFSYDNSTELDSLNISAKVGQKVSAANVTFLSCVSNQDRIPLTMGAYLTAMNGTTSFYASLQAGETSYSTSSSGAIAELPGPLANRTG